MRVKVVGQVNFAASPVSSAYVNVTRIVMTLSSPRHHAEHWLASTHINMARAVDITTLVAIMLAHAVVTIGEPRLL